MFCENWELKRLIIICADIQLIFNCYIVIQINVSFIVSQNNCQIDEKNLTIILLNHFLFSYSIVLLSNYSENWFTFRWQPSSDNNIILIIELLFYFSHSMQHSIYYTKYYIIFQLFSAEIHSNCELITDYIRNWNLYFIFFFLIHLIHNILNLYNYWKILSAFQWTSTNFRQNIYKTCI